MEKDEYFDADAMRQIEKMDTISARRVCSEMIASSKTKVNKKQHLLRDIEAAPNSKEISRIMWNAMLAGMGLSTINSQWQKSH